MPLELQTSPNPTTSAKVAGRSVSLGATARSSSDWLKIAAEIRERAFFSANVGDAKILSAMKSRIRDAVDQTRLSGAVMDRGRFIADMKAFLESEGYALGGTKLTDITSNRRLGLIYDMNVQEAQEYARYKNDQRDVRLNMYPAWEFVRRERRRQERQNWRERWQNAGGNFYDGRMIALKTSDVWEKLSVFGRPWAPFDFNSGMGCRDIGRAEAVKIGLMQPDDRLQPRTADFNTGATLPADKIDADILKTGQARGLLGAADSAAVEPRPNPFPISDALEIEIENDELRHEIEEAIRLINTIHGDGVLPRITIKENNHLRRANAQYAPFGKNAYIEVKRRDGAALSTIHEIGHFLDNQGLNSKGKTWASTSDMDEVIQSIRNSKGFNDGISKIRADARKSTNSYRRQKLNEFAKYLESPEESFARAYAQFIATESQNKKLLKELDDSRDSKFYQSQWDDEDFKPIHQAIKKLFKTKGWM